MELKNFTDHDLMVIQKTGIDADNFLRNYEFYTKHLKPGLDYERDKSKKDGDWKPGSTTDTNGVLLYNAYNSGKQDGLTGIDIVCRRLINQGISAGVELAKRAKKNAVQK